MTPTKTCPRCGSGLSSTGDKFVCPSCHASGVRKPKDPRSAGVSPALHAAETPASRGLILGGAALFLLLGMALTGYAFALTFSSKPEGQPVGGRLDWPLPDTDRPEDWRATLTNLRELVTTPPATPTQPIDNPKPEVVSARANKAIDKGVAFLKQVLGERAGGRYAGPVGSGLAGLTLLECGVPASDPVIRRLAEQVRKRAPALSATYQIATDIWFLDRLGDKRDHDLIRSLALRLIANQKAMGGWDYASAPISAQDETALLQLLAEKPLSANWRDSMTAALAPDRSGRPVTGDPAPRGSTRMEQLPLFRWEPGKKLAWHPAGREDNSLTQFAILALWSARKHGVPVERCLAFVEARFRTYQNADGSWGYALRTTGHRDSMTCAGLLGLAVGRGLGKQSDQPKGDVKDKAIDKALIYVGQVVGKKPLNRGATVKGRLIAAQALGDLYFLWSMERIAVVYDLKTIAGKDWYAWGSELILDAQSDNGSWHEAFPGVPDTCFALLFLKRVNIAQDLTAQLRLLGKVKDPGHGKPAVVLPGETVKPDD